MRWRGLRYAEVRSAVVLSRHEVLEVVGRIACRWEALRHSHVAGEFCALLAGVEKVRGEMCVGYTMLVRL